MNRQQLLERLEGIEWQDFEVKAAAGGVPRDALRTVSAFANSGGGWLVFGVSERGSAFEITGISDPDRFQNDLLSACRSPEKFHRPPQVLARALRLYDRWVLCLHVQEAGRLDKPVRVKAKGTWECYVRVGAGDHRCTPEEEGRFLRDASLERFDQAPYPQVSVDDLDPESARWLQGLITLRRPEARAAVDLGTWLQATTLALPDGTLTRAAALLLGREPVIGRIKPGGLADLRVMSTPAAGGIPAHRWDDRLLCEGNLVQTLRTLFERLHRLCPQPFAFEPNSPHRRARAPEEDALREALVNLIAHQDYADPSRTATILWWRDRVSFENPGDSFVPTEFLWQGGYSEPRNPLIIRLLRQAGLAEQAGSGLPYVRRLWTTAQHPAPTLHNDPARKRFEVVFEWNTATGGVSGGVSGGVDEGAGASDEVVSLEDRLLAMIAAEPGLRVPALEQALSQPRRTIERALRRLRDRGRISFEGAPRTGGYVVVQEQCAQGTEE